MSDERLKEAVVRLRDYSADCIENEEVYHSQHVKNAHAIRTVLDALAEARGASEKLEAAERAANALAKQVNRLTDELHTARADERRKVGCDGIALVERMRKTHLDYHPLEILGIFEKLFNQLCGLEEG